ncbi:MAG: hypothetical protein A2Z88_02865 [Omnitrophica WOR_2 bacterium GWA2_47_8]|nr:MAG: hypothetical protein A2Z88_02865 [Omnitrophica WOR_2 bacterium GWA2_47_8]
MLRAFILLGVLAMVSGCATKQQGASLNSLQMKVTELESELAQKDEEINDLRYEMSRVAQNVRTSDRSRSDDSSGGSSKRTGTIRVSASVEDVQSALKKAGYYEGSIDGKLGSGTKQAISSFQRDNGLNADGIIGRKTWDLLKQNLD